MVQYDPTSLGQTKVQLFSADQGQEEGSIF